MNRTYSVECAKMVGGIQDAVVLNEVAAQCNEQKKAHNGRFWACNSASAWQEVFPEIPNVRVVLDRLAKNGWLLVGNYNDSPFDRKKWYSISDKSVHLFFKTVEVDVVPEVKEPEEKKPVFNPAPEPSLFPVREAQEKPEAVRLAPPKPEIKEPEPKPQPQPVPEPKPEKPINTAMPAGNIGIDRIMSVYSKEIERIYKLYPTKTFRGERGTTSTGKCSQDKRRIAALLRYNKPEKLEQSIKKYVEDTGGQYIKNFSTFLNNLPEYEDDVVPESTGEAPKASGQNW